MKSDRSSPSSPFTHRVTRAARSLAFVCAVALKKILPTSLLTVGFALGGIATSQAANIDWDGGPTGLGTTWNTAANWLPNGVPASAASIDLIRFGSTGPTSGTLDNDIVGQTLTRINVGGNGWTLNGNAITLSQFNTTAPRLFFNADTDLNFNLDTTVTGGPLEIQTRAATADIYFGGKLSGSTGLIVANVNGGAGAQVLLTNATNDFTGGITVNTAGGSAPITTLVGNTAAFNNNNLLIGSGGSEAQVIFNQATDGTYSGTLSGNGALIKQGAGKLTLSANSGIALSNGGSTIENGTVAVSHANALGNGTIKLGATSGTDNATLQILGVTGLNGNTIESVAGSSGTKTLTVQDSGSVNVTLGGGFTLNDDLTIDSVTANRITFIDGVITGSNDLIINSGNQQSNRVEVRTDNAATYSGTTIISRGRVYGRTSNNAFGTGTIQIGGGSTDNFAALYSANDVTIGNNIVVDAGASQRRIGNAGFGLDADGATFTGNILLNANLQVEPDGDASGGTAVTLTGNISGAGGLQIDGAPNRGVLISGTNTYGGTTTVNAGTLIVNGDNSAAMGVLTVASGATLAGNGTIGGASTVLGTHTPGTSPGVQSFVSDLTYSGGASAVVWELTANTASLGNRGTLFDGIDVGGNLDFLGATTLTLNFDLAGSLVDWSDLIWGSNQSWLLYDVAGTTTNLSNFSIFTADWTDKDGDLFNTVLSGSSFDLSQLGNDVFLNFNSGSAIPEPSRMILLGMAAFGLVMRRRRA